MVDESLDVIVVEWKFVVVNADGRFAVEDAGVVVWNPVVSLVNTDGRFAEDCFISESDVVLSLSDVDDMKSEVVLVDDSREEVPDISKSVNLLVSYFSYDFNYKRLCLSELFPVASSLQSVSLIFKMPLKA